MPGVYVQEKTVTSGPIVAVATAVPAFVGYTERADNKGASLRNKPWRITSWAEFVTYFGEAPPRAFRLHPAALLEGETGEDLWTPDGPCANQSYLLECTSTVYLLYDSMRLFFQNGGGPCYVVSVGGFNDPVSAVALMAGIDVLTMESEPTLLVIPDAVQLPLDDCIAVQQHMLNHCGTEMKNRFAILDVPVSKEPPLLTADPMYPVAAFRSRIGQQNLAFGAAYFPWLHTSVISVQELSVGLLDTESSHLLGNLPPVASELQGQLQASGSGIQRLLELMARQLNYLPPSAAMAGIYTAVDNARGVWKAPANVSLNAVLSPAVSLSIDQQDPLNSDGQGMSVNAIRSFVGQGTLVWGARTLDGNSQDWRYVNVRRTMIMLEESIRLAAKAFVFETNTASTWATVKGIISNFLTGIWQQGGLMGSKAEEAFAVYVGLGETMTADDILEGFLRVTVLVALTRPAEFIEITFQQQMQKS